MAERFGLKEDTIIRIQRVFAAFPQVEQVILYGSRAKGNYKPGSDIDLTMVANQTINGENPLDLTIQFQIEDALEELMLPYQCDLSIMETIEKPQSDRSYQPHRSGVLPAGIVLYLNHRDTKGSVNVPYNTDISAIPGGHTEKSFLLKALI